MFGRKSKADQKVRRIEELLDDESHHHWIRGEFDGQPAVLIDDIRMALVVDPCGPVPIEEHNPSDPRCHYAPGKQNVTPEQPGRELLAKAVSDFLQDCIGGRHSMERIRTLRESYNRSKASETPAAAQNVTHSCSKCGDVHLPPASGS